MCNAHYKTKLSQHNVKLYWNSRSITSVTALETDKMAQTHNGRVEENWESDVRCAAHHQV